MEYFSNEFPETLNEPWCSFPYEFHVTNDEFRSKIIRDWLNDNIVEWKEHYGSMGEENSFLFKYEEDAMAFKLTWFEY